MNPTTIPSKTLSGMDVTLYAISAILLVDQIALSAAVGESAIFWWLVVILCFMLPNTLVTAELGTRYPEQGGIYAWVRNAFGARWGARITWLYWINIALWMPAIYLMFAGIVGALYVPDLSLWGQIALGVALCWLTAAINCLPLSASKWIPNLGTPLKFFVVLALGAGGLWQGVRHGFANDVGFLSALDDPLAGLGYLPVIVYGCLGIELVSAESERIRHASRNVPRAMLLAALLTAVLYIFGTLGVLAAVPGDQIDTVTIIAVSVQRLFGDVPAGQWLALGVGGAALFTFFSTMVTWTLGGNRSMAEAAQAGEMPALLARQHRTHRAPIGAALATSAIASLILLTYGLMATSAEALFWTIFAFGAILFLMPYIAMHLAFLRLRGRDAGRKEVFRLPGGRWVSYPLSTLCIAILAAAILLFFWVPGEPFDSLFSLQVGGGVLVSLTIGEVLVYRSERRRLATAVCPASRTA
ncbi:APC family permease [Halomonas sp. THAF12]|uniref:APC family permease n=1 Tax=Halomonas sp. B23F22_10 TaxID=3459515 RepID=UPI00373E81B9